MSCGRFRRDPGPCPVDDTPHTACTPATVGSLTMTARPVQTVTTPLYRPGWLPPNAPQTVETVSTKTYRGRTRARR